MERPNQELLNAYRKLQKEKKRKKSYNPSPLEAVVEISLIVLVLGLFVYFMVECYTKELKTAYGVLGAMLFFAVILLVFMESGRSRLFGQEKVALDKWNADFKDFLKESNISELEIDKLLEWCDMVLKTELPIDKLLNRLDKMFSIFMIPAVIAFVYKWDETFPDGDIWLKQIFNGGITLVLAMIGLLVYVAIPGAGLFVKSDRTVLEEFRMDLAEYKLFYSKFLSKNAGPGKTVEMKYQYSYSESKFENGVEDKREREDISVEKMEQSK